MGTSLLSPLHLVILLIVALLLFGAKRLPEIGRSLGVGMREFKDSVTSITDATSLETRSELPPPAPAAPVPAAPVVAAPVTVPAPDASVPAAAPADTEREAS
jgi:sec-independent protein translocase protein TatA